MVMSLISIGARTSARRSAAGCIRVLWKGALTGKIGVNLAMKALDGISSLGKMGWLASARNVRTAFNDINTIAAENGTSVNNVLKAAKAAESGDTSLLSKLLGSIQSPITNFARVMNQLAEKGGASACEAPAAEEAPAEAPAAE